MYKLVTLAMFVTLMAGCNAIVPPGTETNGPVPDAEAQQTHLVTSDWLNQQLGASKLVVIDARATADYVEEHLPGAVSASFSEEEAISYDQYVSYGCGLDFFVDADNEVPFQDGPPAQIQAAVRDFGIDRDATVVVYGAGASFHEARFFWTLTQHGFEHIYILDGGLQKWMADGYTTTIDIPTPVAGDFVATQPDLSLVATTDDVFAAIDDPNTVIVSGLTPIVHYGSYNAYTIPGHIPTTQPISMGYFFNADYTWKSIEEMQLLLRAVDVTPDKTIITYCGGGPLSACVHYTFKYVLGYPDVRNYTGSYLAWISDPRVLPVNTYGNDDWLRDTAWCYWWVGERMQRLMPASPALAVDVRPAADYEAGHVSWSVNLPMDGVTAADLADLDTWADALGDLGAGDDIEVVIVDETITPRTTLLFWLLQYLGHEQVSLASEGLAGWRGAGYETTTDETVIADALTPIDVAIQPAKLTVDLQSEFVLTDVDAANDYPFSRVWVVSAEELPDDIPVDNYIHVPWSANLTEDGLLNSAGTLWTLYDDAGVTYFSEIVCYSDNVAEASMTYFVLRLLGFPRVEVYVP